MKALLWTNDKTFTQIVAKSPSTSDTSYNSYKLSLKKKQKKEKPTNHIKKHSSLHVIPPNLNLCTKHTIEGFIIKIQTTHIIFFASSPPKGKVCREKWRGNPIWQMLVLFSNVFYHQEVQKTFWYHWGGCRTGTYTEWNKSEWLVWHSLKMQAVKIWQNILFKERSTRNLHTVYLKLYDQSLYNSRLCTSTPWASVGNNRADQTPARSDQPEWDVVQYIRLPWKQLPHLSLSTHTLMVLKKVKQAFVEACLAHK